MKNVYNIAIVSNHQVFSKGFGLIIKGFDIVNDVFYFSVSQEMVASSHILKNLDVIFIDLEVLILERELLLERAKHLKIIVFLEHDEICYFPELKDVGCNGYLSKDSCVFEVELAITCVCDEHTYIGQNLMVNKMNEQEELIIKDWLNDFTTREKEIIKYICQGYTSRQIAVKLKISKRTVDKHREKIHIKAGVNSAAELVCYCMKNNIVFID